MLNNEIIPQLCMTRRWIAIIFNLKKCNIIPMIHRSVDVNNQLS